MLTQNINECSICFVEITNFTNVYTTKYSVGIVCEKCNAVFTSKEKEIVIHAFNVAQGIFDIGDKASFIIKDVLFDVQSELKRQNERPITLEYVFQKILIRSQVYHLSLNTSFYINIYYPESPLKHSVCIICNKKIIETHDLYDYKLKNNALCENCYQTFSKEEITTIICLFSKYGGSFNMFYSKRPRLIQILSEILNTIKKENNFSRIIEINEKALHRTLLSGYTPKSFREMLKRI
ncbi:MAG: hypothetical protein ACFFG0_26575 [Candidatus Thorarchaeota archaeon]